MGAERARVRDLAAEDKLAVKRYAVGEFNMLNMLNMLGVAPVLERRICDHDLSLTTSARQVRDKCETSARQVRDKCETSVRHV